MSQQEYYHVFESILYAAIITQLLIGWSRMIMEKGSYDFSWIHLLLSIDFLLFIVQRYYSFQSMSHYSDITNSLSFLINIVLPPSVGFIATIALFPKSLEGSNLNDHLIKYRLPIGMGLIIMIGYTLYRNIVNANGYVELINLSLIEYVPHILFILLFICFILKRSLILAAITAVLSFVVIVYFLIKV